MEGTQYIFSHDDNAMILKIVGATHTGLSGHIVFVEYIDDEIASFYNIVTV